MRVYILQLFDVITADPLESSRMKRGEKSHLTFHAWRCVFKQRMQRSLHKRENGQDVCCDAAKHTVDESVEHIHKNHTKQ